MSLTVIVAFCLVFTWVLVAAVLGFKYYESKRRKQMSAILNTVSGKPEESFETNLLRDVERTQGGLLGMMNLSEAVSRQIRQAGLDWTPTRLFGMTGMAVVFGLVVGSVLPSPLPTAAKAGAGGLLCAGLPYFTLRRKRAARLAALEEQLPEALDFMARSMRAGHAFSISLEMLGEEMGEPLGLEFRTLFNELNLGAPLDVALRNLTERVPLLDVRFFSSAVLMQRQTGGNLSEILARLSYVIRERFRLKGQVKAASAHGRMTAGILSALPIFTMAAMFVVAPGYLEGLAADEDGRYLIAGSIVGQIIGNIVIQKIIAIKV